MISLSETAGAIVRRGGVSRTIFAISLIVVAVASGLTGYFLPGLFTSSKSTITLNGDGATFPYPFLSSVAANYSSSHSNIHVNYQPVGSTQGVTDFSAKRVDFAASDRPMNDMQRAGAPNSLHIPEVVGAVAIGYRIRNNSANAPLPTGLILNITVAAEIFSGAITYWNDAAIKQLNPTMAQWLPGDPTYGPIILDVRGDGSGTAFIFSSFLNQSGTYSSFQWPASIGASNSPNWPTMTGGRTIYAQGNAGVASVLQRNYNTIGFVELNYVLSATPQITYAFVDNVHSGAPVQPTLNTVNLAVANPPPTTVLPNGNASWSRVSLINSPNGQAYPIVGFTYILVHQELNVIPGMTQAKAAALVDFLWFLVHEGQQQAAPLSYSQLPSAAVTIDEATINSITYNGAKLR